MPRMKLKPCPFCNEKIKDEFPTVSKIDENEWQVCHYCEHPFGALGVTITVYGVTKKQAVHRWNDRKDGDQS